MCANACDPVTVYSSHLPTVATSNKTRS